MMDNDNNKFFEKGKIIFISDFIFCKTDKNQHALLNSLRLEFSRSTCYDETNMNGKGVVRCQR